MISCSPDLFTRGAFYAEKNHQHKANHGSCQGGNGQCGLMEKHQEMTMNFPEDRKQDVNDRTQRESGYGRLIVLLLGVIWLWLVTLGLSLLWSDSSGERANFGAMFGSVNSLFSGLAFACLIYAIFLQKADLDLQRRELRGAREQFRRQADQLEAQGQLVTKQNFESTFFSMLQILTRQAQEITAINSASHELKGQEALEYLYSQFVDICQTEIDKEVPPDLTKYEYAFILMLRQNRGLLNYLGTFVHALGLLDKSGVKNKAFYGTFMSSQLHSPERCLLFYYGLLKELHVTKARMETYFVLNGIELGRLVEPSHHKLYAERAWTPFNED
jgi:hypothetical protein